MRSRIAHTFFLFFYAIPFMLSLYINYSHASAAPMPQPTDEPVTVIEISDPTATPTTPTATPISTPSPSPTPTPTVTPSPSPEQEQPTVLKDSLVTVKVFDRTDNRVIELTMHDYIIRCVAGEMPATFPMEALKAQAVAARTFTARHMTSSCSSNSKAHVCTYHGCCQAYVSPERMQKNWGANYADRLEKITRAVEETDGLVMTYNGEPITVFYFSTSNGYTEACQDVFVKNLPYYTSVKSPGEESAPNYYSYVKISNNEFISTVKNKLGITISGSIEQSIDLQRSAGGRVKYITICGTKIKGTQFRTALGLKSTDFRFTFYDDQILIEVYGYGHGVGMSQLGAKAMAEGGSVFSDILAHYYVNTNLCQIY